MTGEVSLLLEQALPELDVLAVELTSPSRFCVFVDHPAGVDHALCQRVTDLLRGYLDRYAVEVSSPGTERPLRKPDHFQHALGQSVALRTATAIHGSTRFRGRVVAARDKSFRLATETDEFDIPYENLVRGNLIDEE
ncbi:MAG: ribosome maturation factor RimP [Gaiellaceae bacterium]